MHSRPGQTFLGTEHTGGKLRGTLPTPYVGVKETETVKSSLPSHPKPELDPLEGYRWNAPKVEAPKKPVSDDPLEGLRWQSKAV